MGTLLVAFGSFFAFIVAYNTYGRWLSRHVFNLDADAVTPSHQLRDDVDFVPTKKEVIFGHHFTSIAGTGPIVGPAIAVFWGWLPALLWVLFGSIFIGALHDFGALVVSLRNRGQTVGEVAGRIINPRAKVLFLLVLFMALTIVLAIFGLVIASIFALYPRVRVVGVDRDSDCHFYWLLGVPKERRTLHSVADCTGIAVPCDLHRCLSPADLAEPHFFDPVWQGLWFAGRAFGP